jgi:hypothetical protein
VSGRSVHTFSASTLERLERGGARVSYELSVTPVRDEGMVVCFAPGRVLRWLGRGGDETPLADGDGFPAKVLVPRTWASTALLLATLSGALPRTLPWHDAKFSSTAAAP